MNKNDAVLIFCAHNDDHIIGAGGTIAQYTKNNTDVITVVFSYGEATHPWLKKKEAIKMRVEESQKADSLIGVKLYYLGLKEGKFVEQIAENKIEEKILRFIKIVKPSKIFTHSEDDPHPDHRAVVSLVKKVVKKTKYNGDVYSFDVWNPFNIRKRNMPKLVVDVTKTFALKIKAIKQHESQWMALALMLPATYLRAFLNGLDKGVRYAEVFVKIR